MRRWNFRPLHFWGLIGCLWLAGSSGELRGQSGEPDEDAVRANANQPSSSESVEAAVLRAQQARVEAIAKAAPTAVSVFVPGGAGGGSGVLISPDGFALTNFHVSSPAGSYMRCGLSNGEVYDAVIVGIDPVGDLALIKLLGRDDFPAAEMADSDQLEVGQWCFVVGNPFLLATNLQPTVTWGMLSGVHRYQYPSGTLLEYADCLQTDASINPGNSGGPIYDAQGRLIGIVGRASFEKRGRVNVGVGYAISINQAKHFLGYLRSGRIVDHATLGATVVTDPEGGVRVSNILESSDAYRRGLRYNDEILEVAGRVVQTANDVQNMLGTLPKGWRVPLSYARDGKRFDILVRLAGVHREDELLEKMGMALPPPPPAEPTPRGAKPEGDNEGDASGDEEEAGPARPKGADGKPIPQVVLDVLKERRGFANYYFNTQHQQRLERSMRATAPAGDGQPKAWVIRGEAEGMNKAAVEIRITPAGSTMQVGDKTFGISSTADRFDAVDDRGALAILPALEAWRSMLESGVEQFGDVVYVGTAPFLGEEPLRDVLRGTAGEVENRFIQHPGSGRVEAIEVMADRGKDPAELIVDWGKDAAATVDSAQRQQPETLELRYGTDVLLRLRVREWNVADASEGS